MLYSWFELTDVVDCDSGARVEMSVMSIKEIKFFHSLRRDPETLLSVVKIGRHF